MARMQSTSTKYINGKSSFAAGKFNFYGDNRDQRSYTSWTTQWLTECHRVLKSGAPVCIFTDWRQIPTITDAVQWSEYCWRGIFVWDKKNGRPHREKFRQQCEFVIWGSKGDLYVDKDDPVYLKGLVAASIPSSKHRQHQTEKPQAVIDELVKIVKEGGTILDPFSGSGSTGVAALDQGRKFIGIEKSEYYYNVAEQRLEATKIVAAI